MYASVYFAADDYIFEEKLDQNEPTQTTGILKKNIDTYENAGTNMYGDYRNNPIYNKDNYLKNTYPGYGMGYGGYGMYGYGTMPYGYNMGNYGMGYGMNNFGMPFNNSFLYPNINTFGSYKNIDTYRSRKKLDKEQEKDLQEQNIIQEENYQEKILKPMPYPMPRPEPIPRPYPTQKPIEDIEIMNEEDLANKPMILPNFDEDIDIVEPKNETKETMTKPEIAKNDEEQFVDNQKEPTIEKIVDGDWVVYRIEF